MEQACFPAEKQARFLCTMYTFPQFGKSGRKRHLRFVQVPLPYSSVKLSKRIVLESSSLISLPSIQSANC